MTKILWPVDLSHILPSGNELICGMPDLHSLFPLVNKYNQSVPRYTSYPTVPFWQPTIPIDQWQQQFTNRFITSYAQDGISLYIHLPFCESLCTYCGCNKKITTNHSVENDYIKTLEMEWALYRQLMPEAPVIREIHLGGGTPTFFSPQNLYRLLTGILKSARLHPEHAFSIEGHPNNTTAQHLEVLYTLGFRRISYGVQDLDPRVQQVINRLQPFENVQRATDQARAAGFTSVNFDLIYGLPLQTADSITTTIGRTLELRPDRIAFYSYAHVPWTSKGQRLFSEKDLPAAEEKLRLYLLGQELLMAAGYHDIGMDHFSLPHDELFTARQNGQLHRNFMGYTTHNSALLLGLGVSAISDTGNAFAQNDKTLRTYYSAVQGGYLPVQKGFFLNEEDIAFRQYITEIACKGSTRFQPAHLPLIKQFCFPVLETPAADGLVVYDDQQLAFTENGHYFMRIICSAFDLYLQRNRNASLHQTFSKAV